LKSETATLPSKKINSALQRKLTLVLWWWTEHLLFCFLFLVYNWFKMQLWHSFLAHFPGCSHDFHFLIGIIPFYFMIWA
jgi:hypothetical protein